MGMANAVPTSVMPKPSIILTPASAQRRMLAAGLGAPPVTRARMFLKISGRKLGLSRRVWVICAT